MKVHDFKGTCSIDRPREGCLMYVTDIALLDKIKDIKVTVLGPPLGYYMTSSNVTYIESDNPFFDFVRIHNEINWETEPPLNRFGFNNNIHPMSCIGNEGMRYLQTEFRTIAVKHMGNVVVGNDVTVGPFSSIARAVFDSTRIDDHVKIGSGCQIGHNVHIGRKTIVIDGAVVLGSVKVGKECYLGGNCVIRNGVSITDQVLVGMGAVVTKDIKASGMYFGNPARHHGDWDGVWP